MCCPRRAEFERVEGAFLEAQEERARKNAEREQERIREIERAQDMAAGLDSSGFPVEHWGTPPKVTSKR